MENMNTCTDCCSSETDYKTDAVMTEGKKLQMESEVQQSLGNAVLEIYIFTPVIYVKLYVIFYTMYCNGLKKTGLILCSKNNV